MYIYILLSSYEKLQKTKISLCIGTTSKLNAILVFLELSRVGMSARKWLFRKK